MTGVIMATAGVAAAGGSGGGGTAGGTVSPNALAWTSIAGVDDGSSNNQTISGISAPMSIAATITGSGVLFYTQNGAPYVYGGAFTVHNGDVIGWSVSTPGASRVSGTITVLNDSDGGATLCTIPYHLASSGNN
jgi:hypothetical protein